MRLGTTDADAAHSRLRDAGATLHDEEFVHVDGTPPMFFFADPTATVSSTSRALRLHWLIAEPRGRAYHGLVDVRRRCGLPQRGDAVDEHASIVDPA